MNKKLFLYLDILGFASLCSSNHGKVRKIFEAINGCNIYKDRNFKAIVLSDTLIAFNAEDDLGAMVTELGFLIENVHHITDLLTGSGITFRAIICLGEFEFAEMSNINAYFGAALIKSHNDEKSKFPATGLFLHNSVMEFNSWFPAAKFSDEYHFSFLAYDLARLDNQKFGYPVPWELMDWPEDAIKRVMFQIEYLRFIYSSSFDGDPGIRSKYLNTWAIYQRSFPKLTDVLLSSDFNPSAISDINWEGAKECLQAQIASFDSLG
jgi:hypothetical protein